MQRGDVHRFKVPKSVGHEQRGERFGVVVQPDVMLPRSVVVVAPTSRSAQPASFRSGHSIRTSRDECVSDETIPSLVVM